MMKEFSSAELARNVATVTDAPARAPVAITVCRKPKFVRMAIEDDWALIGDRRRVHALIGVLESLTAEYFPGLAIGLSDRRA
jgi:hypothetical protein